MPLVSRGYVLEPYLEIGHLIVEEIEDDRFTGTWYSAVGKFDLDRRLQGLVRVGYDGGDDEGGLWGVGGEYTLGPDWRLRTEYVERSDLFSLQVQVTYSLF
jgi:hypothetical protein